MADNKDNTDYAGALQTADPAAPGFVAAGRRLDTETYNDIASLRAYISTVLEQNTEQGGLLEIADWGAVTLGDLFVYEREYDTDVVARADYRSFPLAAGSGALRVPVHVDTRFDEPGAKYVQDVRRSPQVPTISTGYPNSDITVWLRACLTDT